MWFWAILLGSSSSGGSYEWMDHRAVTWQTLEVWIEYQDWVQDWFPAPDSGSPCPHYFENSNLNKTGLKTHYMDTSEDVQFSDTIQPGADRGSLSPPSSHTQNSSRQSEPTRGERKTANEQLFSTKWAFFSHLQSVVFCVHYSGNTDEHGVPLVDGFYFHPHLETMERSLQTQNKNSKKGHLNKIKCRL